MAAWRTLLTALWFGAVVGLLETIPILVLIGRGLRPRVSVHVEWMAPVADLLLFLLTGLLLVLVGFAWRAARSRRVVLGAFAGLGTLCLLLHITVIYDLALLVLAAGVGVQAGRMAGGRWADVLVRWIPVTLVLALAVIAGLAWRSFGQERTREREQLAAASAANARFPNVLLLILDTVRAQSLGLYGHLYGHSKPTSPNLAAIAARGVVFDWAIAPAPWTGPSHASMFTGRWPHELSVDWTRPLDARDPTLAEVLGARGYATAGFVGNLLYAARETGLARGFGRYEDYPVSLGQVVLSAAVGRSLAYNSRFRRLIHSHELWNRKPATEINRAFFDWLNAHHMRNGDRPFFAFLNYYDAHEPYFPPDSVLRGRPWNRYAHRGGVMEGGNSYVDEKFRMTLTEMAIHGAAYEAAAQRTDAAAGNLIAGLERRGALDNTIVIITSDHGEQVGEHGLFAHNNSLYMTVLHVPLVVVWPGQIPAGRRVAATASLRDLPATVLDLIDADTTLPGNSLAVTWTDGDTTALSPGMAYLTRGFIDQPRTPLGRGREMQSNVRVPYHYVHNGDGTDALFDVWRDPHELQNLAGNGATDSVLHDVRSIVFELMTGRPPPPNLPIRPSADPVDPWRRLRSQGGGRP